MLTREKKNMVNKNRICRHLFDSAISKIQNYKKESPTIIIFLDLPYMIEEDFNIIHKTDRSCDNYNGLKDQWRERISRTVQSCIEQNQEFLLTTVTGKI